MWERLLDSQRGTEVVNKAWLAWGQYRPTDDLGHRPPLHTYIHRHTHTHRGSCDNNKPPRMKTQSPGTDTVKSSATQPKGDMKLKMH
jgi:hypothetical protein